MAKLDLCHLYCTMSHISLRSDSLGSSINDVNVLLFSTLSEQCPSRDLCGTLAIQSGNGPEI